MVEKDGSEINTPGRDMSGTDRPREDITRIFVSETDTPGEDMTDMAASGTDTEGMDALASTNDIWRNINRTKAKIKTRTKLERKQQIKKISIICGVLFAVFALAAIIARPKNITVDVSQIEMVTAKVIKVKTPSYSRRYNTFSRRYYVTLEYNGQNYKMGPLSSAAYTEGLSYNFWMAGGDFYPTEKDAEIGLETKQYSIVYKICLPAAFLVFVAWFSFFVDYLMNKNKDNSDLIAGRRRF